MAKNGEAVRRAEKGPLIGVRTKSVIRERWDRSLAELHRAGVGNATGGVLMGSNLVEMWAIVRPTGGSSIGSRHRWHRIGHRMPVTLSRGVKRCA